MGVKIGKAKRILKEAIVRKTPIMLIGPPGIGKSDIVRQVAKEIAEERGLEYAEWTWGEGKYTVIDVRASQMDEAEVRGVPFPHEGRTRWMLPEWLPEGGQGVIFFDEINLAPPSVQAQLYQLVLDRRVGNYVLPEGWSVVAAGNREEDQAAVQDMPAPLRNRMIMLEVEPDVDAWLKWAEENGIHPDIVEFIRENPEYLFIPEYEAYAFPTPRSWAMLSRFMGTEEWYEIAKGLVGEKAARAFRVWRGTRDYTAEKLLRGDIMWGSIPLDARKVITNQLIWLLINHPERWREVERAIPEREILVYILKAIKNRRPEVLRRMEISDSLVRLIKEAKGWT